MTTINSLLRFDRAHPGFGIPGRWLPIATLLLALPFQGWSQPTSLDHFSWSVVPAEARVGQPFTGSIEARDAAEGVVTQYNGGAAICGLAPGTPPAVLITEVETINTKRVEIANFSPAPIDISGWRLVFYDSQGWPNPKTTFIVPSGSTCPPHIVFLVRSDGTSPGVFPAFNLGVSLNWGSSGSFPYTAVVLQDAAGQRLDFFCAISALPNFISLPQPLDETDWSGLPVPANNNLNLTYQRTGAYDHNNANDWVSTNNSFGQVNSGLLLPLIASPIKVAVTPTSITFSNGLWSGDLVFSAPATNLVLRGDDLQGHAGDSAAFVVLPLPPLGILLPPQAFEATPGFVGSGSVSIPAPLE